MCPWIPACAGMTHPSHPRESGDPDGPIVGTAGVPTCRLRDTVGTLTTASCSEPGPPGMPSSPAAPLAGKIESNPLEFQGKSADTTSEHGVVLSHLGCVNCAQGCRISKTETDEELALWAVERKMQLDNDLWSRVGFNQIR